MKRLQRDKEEFISNSVLQRGHKEIKEKGQDSMAVRPQGHQQKTPVEFRQMKMTLVEVFRTSKAVGILQAFFNLQLPPQLLPEGRDVFTEAEDKQLRMLLLSNFKWAVEQLVRLAPKELGVFGRMELTHTLAAMTRRATTSEKSGSVVDMVKRRRDKDVLSYQAESSENNGYQ